MYQPLPLGGPHQSLRGPPAEGLGLWVLQGTLQWWMQPAWHQFVGHVELSGVGASDMELLLVGEASDHHDGMIASVESFCCTVASVGCQLW